MQKIVITAAILVLFFILLLYFELPFDLIRPVFHSETIVLYSRQYEFDPLFITALIKVESNFFRRARSDRGAVGLMQLLPSTARELAYELGYKTFSKTDLENPKINIRLGTYYLYKLRQEFDGNEILALAAYNAGKNKVQLWYRQNPLVSIETSDIPYPETRNYVDNVMGTYKWLKKIQKLKAQIQRKKIQ